MQISFTHKIHGCTKLFNMLITLSINRGFFNCIRAEILFYMYGTVFPKTKDNPHYPGANPLKQIIKDLWDDFFDAHAKKILLLLMKYLNP